MLGITHFAVGAIGGILIAILMDVDERSVPLYMIASGIWAMIPDINKILDYYIVHVFHDSIWANIFWFHQVLDTLETSYPEIEGAVALLLLLIVVVGYRIRNTYYPPDLQVRYEHDNERL